MKSRLAAIKLLTVPILTVQQGSKLPFLFPPPTPFPCILPRPLPPPPDPCPPSHQCGTENWKMEIRWVNIYIGQRISIVVHITGYWICYPFSPGRWGFSMRENGKKLGEIRQHRLILHNRKRAEVARKVKKKRRWKLQILGKCGGKMDPLTFCVRGFSISPFPLFAPLFPLH